MQADVRLTTIVFGEVLQFNTLKGKISHSVYGDHKRHREIFQMTPPKRIILSRKGFDSTAGGKPSPIFPDNTMFSLPIPGQDCDEQTYGDVIFSHNGSNLGQIVEDLTFNRRKKTSNIGKDHLCHLDPDLRHEALERELGWKPAFGQAYIAQSHLNNQKVSEGDLFLFFGLFRRVEHGDGGWKYIKGALQQHVIWGWLQIGEKLEVGNSYKKFKESHPWLAYHAHLQEDKNVKDGEDTKNTIYVAAPRLDLGNLNKNLCGGGVFDKYDKKRVLSAEGESCSKWLVPDWLYPEGKTPLTYHKKSHFEKPSGGQCYLQRKGNGQEFVLKTEEYPESLKWVEGLFMDIPHPT